MRDLTLTSLRVGIDPMSDDKKMRDGKGQQGVSPPTGEAHKFGSEALSKVAELARQELRDKGLSEELIEAILNRRYPPDDL